MTAATPGLSSWSGINSKFGRPAKEQLAIAHRDAVQARDFGVCSLAEDLILRTRQARGAVSCPVEERWRVEPRT